MTNQDKGDRLTSLMSSIIANIKNEEVNNNEHKWERAGFYQELRAMFPSNVLFGNWLKSSIDSPASQQIGESIDARQTITKMIACRECLTKEQFIFIGYTKAAELTSKYCWEAHPEQMTALVEQTHTMSKTVIRSWVKRIKEGEHFVAPPPRPKSTEEKLEEALITIGILKETYVFSEEEFFHPDFKAAQIEQLEKCGAYASLFFGLPSNIVSHSPQEISSAYRRLSRKYHPDRHNQDESAMVVVNRINDFFRSRAEYLSISSVSAERAERVARFRENLGTQ
ncbi:MAG: J domain-containing protein [Phocaeicola sp.]